MDYPDEALHESQVPLQQFVRTAEHLLSQDQTPDNMVRFIRFVLAGRFELDGHQTRIFVNARQAASPPLIDAYQHRRDLDSVIGVTRGFPFRVALALFPLASFRDTLTEDNHVKYNPTSLPGPQSAAGVSLHKIPNMALGKAERRHITRVFFPHLYEKGKSAAISTELRTHIYDKCLRQAAIEVNPLDQSRWPITYAAAMDLYRDDRGLFHFATIDFPPRLLQKFAVRLLELFQMHDELKDAFFVHELRGTKGATHHDPKDTAQRRVALEDMFHAFNTDQLIPREWVIDVAWEIRYKGRVLQWLTKGHRRVLEFILPSAPAEKISDVLNSSTQYHCDLSAQIGDIGGFRSQPGSRGAADRVTYINIYTTDKSATYQLHKGLFKRRKPWHLFPNKIDTLLEDMEKMAETFRTCGGNQTVDGLEGNARLEVRVPLDLAEKTLVDIPDGLIQKSLVAFDCPTFWYFKYYRLAALYNVVKNLRSANQTVRLRSTSLALGALVTYQINALIYRPAEGRAETELLAAASQHICDTKDSSSKPIMYDRGAFFWSDIVDNSEGFLLPNVRLVSSGSILALYRRDFMDDIEAELRESQSQRNIPDATHTTSHNPCRTKTLQRKRKTTSRVVGEGISDASNDDTLTEESTDMTAPTVAPAPKIKDIGGLTDLLRQFPSDILQLVPNPKSSEEEPWCLLTKGDVSRAKVELFQSLDIRRVFRLTQCTMVCADDWQTTVFERYFPRRSFQPPKSLQHYPSAAYYRQWRNLMKEATDEGAIRETVRVWFNKILWLPFPEGDRMWSTRRANGSQWQMVPAGASVELSPRIAINVDRCDKRVIAELGSR